VYLGDESLARSPRAELGLAKDFSERTSEVIDAEVKQIIDAAFADARRLLDANREKLDAIAKALLKYETLDGDEVQRIIAGETIDRPTVAELIEIEAQRRPDKPPLARPIERPGSDEAGALPTPA
jgi:cell division protease FtsH